MADKLTPQQELAVKNRGGRLLVSAAAGSGKTKVLVDRLMDYILDPVRPANLDEFLMITYTKAAAAELRGKIARQLTKQMEKHPENRHLQRQMQRLYLTKISTVHAFCGDILRQYAHVLDLPADFRVADENECAQLRDTVMTRMLDEAYEQGQNDPDFRSFVDAQGLGRDDRLVPEILLKVYDSARCHLGPDEWLTKAVESAAVADLSDAGQTLWGNCLMEELFGYLDLQIRALERCAVEAETAQSMEKPAALLRTTVQQLRYLRESRTWDEILARKNVDYGRLVISKKCPDQDLAERIKAVRQACKDGLEKKLRCFTDESSLVLRDMAGTEPAVRGLVALVRRFGTEYDRAKNRRRIMDFGDLEHRTLDLLLGKRRDHVTAAAREIGLRFREIMVDEYQDSNAVQDAIFGALTQRNNCFMVGDVKQSIYQFRLADPNIFLKKYNTFADAEVAAEGQERKVLLSANFRSGGAVLHAVNDVFRLCMSPAVGGLKYGEEEALQEGIPHEALGEPEVELWAVDVQADTYAEEAEFVARRITQLLDGTHFVRCDQGLRPIVAEDIAILLRSPGSLGHHYIQALERRGIRCSSGGGEDLLQTREIGVLRSILQTVSNPRQDIPLVAALASPVFGFTADDLAAVRSGHRYGSIYDALLASELPRAKAFLEILAVLRREARMGTLAQLLETVFRLTQMDSVFRAMDHGENKTANLQTFYALAVDFESTGRRDLEQFLEHLDALEEKGLIASGDQKAAGTVTVMSIHKSKGLEFPVVFVSGLSKSFNRESIRAQVLCDQTLMLGLSAVDSENRLRYPTVAKRAIAAKMTADSLSEELRVLYVALTRARDRLIMTYASQTLEKDLSEIVGRMDLSGPELLTRDVVCPGEWVLMAALRRTEAGELFRLGGKPMETRLGNPVWRIGVVEGCADAGTAATNTVVSSALPEETLAYLRNAMDFLYDHLAATTAPSKQTATQRKGRQKDEEAAEDAAPEKLPVRHWRKPSFEKPHADGADRGNAVHTAMQYIDYSACGTVDQVKQEVVRLVELGFLRPDQGELVDAKKIAAFFETEPGRKLSSGENVLREFKFSILDDGKNYDPALAGEKILLQGVVDCALMEPDGITVLDFKTDYVTSDTIWDKAEYYRPQVMAYAEALERIYEVPVKSAMLYFFSLGKFVSVLEKQE